MTRRLLSVLVVMMTLCAGAQNAVGDWLIHTSYVGNEVAAVAEGNRWVYYLAGGNLFRLDKETQENEALSRVNDLSDMTISQMYYNSDRDYLVVVYANSNIDVILSDGIVVNMPEIMNAVMTSSKIVNDVTFAPGVIYVATDFGYVVIDDKKFVVKESHVYRTRLTSVAQVGDKLLVSTPNASYYGDASEYHEQLESFDVASFSVDSRLWPISDSTFFCMNDCTLWNKMSFDDEGEAKFSNDTLFKDITTVVQKTKGGYLLNVPNLKKCYKTDDKGLNLVATDTDGEECSANPQGDGTLWAAGVKGLHQMGSESYYMPNMLTFGSPFWMTYNKSRDLLYVSSPATNYFFTENEGKPTSVNTYDGVTWRDVTPENAPPKGSFKIEFMPDDPDTYLLSTWREGLLKVHNDEIIQVYDSTNTPMSKRYILHPIITIDRNGNLWVVQTYEVALNGKTPVMVLPAAKLKQNTSSKSDWVIPQIDGLNTADFTKTAIFISTHNGPYDIKIFNDGDYQRPLVIWNSNGDITSRPQQVITNTLTDQDGQPFTWLYTLCLTEDLNGLVWMGCTEGVVCFNPAQAFSADFRVNHIKVPRNDGTGMADYLLNGIQVNDIAVDGANRKWIATQSSGLFLVSADGTQIIKKFNMTNSPLASNTVYRVCCNPNSNSVYVTTPAGLYEYFSDSSPAEPNYDDIYAYPNPVRPEYLGDVTITGLMDNSLVKIADASGYVIRQLKSTGGMVTWDCCDQYGERVKTGVYLVLCSQANGSGEAVVTKIAVIR
jgi:hypothetical protein